LRSSRFGGTRIEAVFAITARGNSSHFLNWLQIGNQWLSKAYMGAPVHANAMAKATTFK
jgi:hypothetical protein